MGQVPNRQAKPLLRRKDDLHVTYWNVRTLQDVGVQALTMRELRKCNVDIACLSEVRIPNSGHTVIKVPGEEACYHLYHSGVVDNAGGQGVAIALHEAAQTALLAWVPISSRLASAQLKGTTVNLTVVAVYAPTLDSFFDNLQDVVDRVPAGDMLIVAGDWNARPGPVDPATRHILGKFAVGMRCVNGDRLVNFASANRLVASTTRFQHPQRHLVTWFSNDGRTSDQIGHMLVRSRWASSVVGCRAYTCSEHGSDYAMVCARIRLRMKAAPIPNRPAKLDTAKLKTVALEHLRLDL